MIKECTSFKPVLVVAIIHILGGSKFLDFSAGWGDRLIGAIAAGVKRYVGVDPNHNLKEGHSAIIQRFCKQEEVKNFEVIYEPFQTATLPQNETFDLIFTSPPFFDFEIYINSDGQSVKEYPKFEDWLVFFLCVSLKKCWGVLENEGHMAIHVADVYKTKVCEVMNLFIQLLPGAHYYGLISSTGAEQKPRPIWIWKKLGEHSELERTNQAKSFLEKYFSSIYGKMKTILNK